MLALDSVAPSPLQIPLPLRFPAAAPWLDALQQLKSHYWLSPREYQQNHLPSIPEHRQSLPDERDPAPRIGGRCKNCGRRLPDAWRTFCSRSCQTTHTMFNPPLAPHSSRKKLIAPPHPVKTLNTSTTGAWVERYGVKPSQRRTLPPVPAAQKRIIRDMALCCFTADEIAADTGLNVAVVRGELALDTSAIT